MPGLRRKGLLGADISRRHDLPKLTVECLRVIVRFDLAGEFPEAFVLLFVLNLAAWRFLGRLPRPFRLRHRTGAPIAWAPYMARPAAGV